MNSTELDIILNRYKNNWVALIHTTSTTVTLSVTGVGNTHEKAIQDAYEELTNLSNKLNA